jgi:hypothetical protein
MARRHDSSILGAERNGKRTLPGEIATVYFCPVFHKILIIPVCFQEFPEGLHVLGIGLHPTLGRFLVLGMGTQHVKGSLLNGRYLRLSKFLENAADEIRHDI